MTVTTAKAPAVVCVAYDRWSLFEAGIVSEVFGLRTPEHAAPLYRFRVAQVSPEYCALAVVCVSSRRAACACLLALI